MPRREHLKCNVLYCTWIKCCVLVLSLKPPTHRTHVQRHCEKCTVCQPLKLLLK